ncbi:gfo/Idh/MocA family oxidoreductase [Dysgonomonas sp. 521]|uniref:Gfo/Idh/MocA family protein n=1 Tax=Dysgonomonas sp. 521 TaxID=2302932 RepID=UPI0013D835F1|nr:Gfo/Idh/MocA family oxidoreductase [Dysgonomonas sp. 521]NDV94578.1 gfo/Idh/MocA family oxidoreductase [Dysgonomonas sp. 521]
MTSEDKKVTEPDKENNQKPQSNGSPLPESQGRRDALKALATVPILGAMAYGVYKKQKYDKTMHDVSDVFSLSKETATIPDLQPNGKQIRLGIIGCGIRGKQLLRAAGFATPQSLQDLIDESKKDKKDTRYQLFKEQEDLNVVLTGVCDIFDTFAEQGVAAGANINREGLGGKLGPEPKRYRHYQEMLAADDIDAVIIATPDHWHSTMAMDAAKAGKHVYVEKPLSWTVPETYMVRDVIKQTGVVFQLGHQGRQVDSYHKAKEIIDKGLLGPISLIEVCTNRNDPNGAWVYDIDPTANPKTIDWKQFEGDEERVKEYMDYMTKYKLEKYVGPDERGKFSLERFFRWRCWWDYSTGLSGDLLTHEYDAINQLMGVGIPHSATSSGGVYFFKDGRTVPDVLQTTFEFPDKDMTMLYSATLASNRNRGKVIMGHDASMEVGDTLTVKVDSASTRYKDKIDNGIIKPDVPFYTYVPGKSNVDAVTSATELYFAQRGLLYSYLGGKRYDTTFLHIREWLEAIRDTNKKISCGIDAAFEEAITAHMGTRAYLEGRTMYWDKDKEEIVRS